MEVVLVGVGAEATTGAGVRAVQGTGAAVLGAELGVGLAAEQLKDSGDRHGGANGVEVDGGAGRLGALFPALLACLPQLLAAVSSLGEFAIALAVNGLIVAEEFVLGGDVADGAVQANVIVMSDEVGHDAAGVVEGGGQVGGGGLAFGG